jgi:chemotaxis methyl-accepting protein methylase
MADDREDALALFGELRTVLDPSSRYVAELDALIGGAHTAEEMSARLSGECRGALHAKSAYARMSLKEKVLANLITAETAPLRFSKIEVALIESAASRLAASPLRALIAPCSRGEEAFSVAHYLSSRRRDFEICALDVQPALIDHAHRLPNPNACAEWPESLQEAAAELAPSIRFRVADAFALPEELGRFDMVFCRNFLGYFVDTEVQRALGSILDRTSARSVLLLDDFCLSKFGWLARRVEERGFERVQGTAVFERR